MLFKYLEIDIIRPHGAVVALLIPVQKVVRSNRAVVTFFTMKKIYRSKITTIYKRILNVINNIINHIQENIKFNQQYNKSYTTYYLYYNKSFIILNIVYLRTVFKFIILKLNNLLFSQSF